MLNFFHVHSSYVPLDLYSFRSFSPCMATSKHQCHFILSVHVVLLVKYKKNDLTTHHEMMPLPLLSWLKWSSAFSIFLYHCCQVLAPAEFNWKAGLIFIHLVTLLRWYIIFSCLLGKPPTTQPWSDSTPVLEGVKVFDATLFPDHLTHSFKN